MDNGNFEVSVIMATYNPVWEKCVFTLDSVIGQKGVRLELIIVDDGSADNLFAGFAGYFESKGFTDYRLIDHKENQGTVKNYLDGISAAKGRYIKLISPGDALFSESSLAEWIRFLDESGKSWSFADAVYYGSFDGKAKINSTPLAPRVIDCYLEDDEPVCRWNYIVLEDLPLGAAILCDRSLFLEYLNIVTGKVIYSEDLSYMLMMFDGIVPAYYSKPCIFYEFGCGVSTSSDQKWRDRFLKDLREAELLIMNKENKDTLQVKISNALTKMNSGNNSKKRLVKNMQKGGFKKVVKFRFDPRMSSEDISGCGKWWNDYEHRY